MAFPPSNRQVSVQIQVNGAATEVSESLTARELIERLELSGKRIALEVNGEVLPRSLHASHRLNPGDRVEIIHAVGGG